MRNFVACLLTASLTMLVAGCGTGEYNALLQQAIASMPAAAEAADTGGDPGLEEVDTGPRGGQTTLGGKQSTLGQVMNAAMRTKALSQLGQVMFSVAQYESINGSYPARAITDANGTPLLSWRVELLKVLDPTLYSKFNTKEPWDSPDNLQWLDRMPDVYDVGYALEPGFTAVLAMVGDDTVFSSDNQGKRNVEMRDGPQRTGAIVVTDSGSAVEWTKPDDITLNKSNPAEGVAWPDDSFIVGFIDGSAHRVNNLDPTTLNAIFTVAGGEIVNASDL